MKLILENWNAYVQNCKNTIVEENNINENPEEEDVIEEMSSMVGGHVQGYVGSPISDKKTVDEFNESEKEISELKGERLAEMFSTSTLAGGLPQSVVSPEEEYAGHVERSKHQGLCNVVESDDDTQSPQGETDGDTAGIKWKLSDFADNSRNAGRVFEILKDIKKNIGLEKLRDTILLDKSSRSRVEVMNNKFGYSSDLLELIQNKDEGAINKYYQFLINEFLFWIAFNPMSSAQQYAGRSILLSKSTKDLAYGLVSLYVANPNKYNPRTKGQKMIDQAKEYKLDKDLDPALYELPEE